MRNLLAIAAALALSAPAMASPRQDPEKEPPETNTVPTESPEGKALQGGKSGTNVTPDKNAPARPPPETSQAISDPSGSANDSSSKHKETSKKRPPGSDTSGATMSPDDAPKKQ
jgi:hypothetical protein